MSKHRNGHKGNTFELIAVVEAGEFGSGDRRCRGSGSSKRHSSKKTSKVPPFRMNSRGCSSVSLFFLGNGGGGLGGL